MYFNCCCSYSFEPEIIKIGQSSHKIHSNNILNSQESTTILNAYTKKVWKLIVCTSYLCIYIYIYIERERERDRKRAREKEIGWLVGFMVYPLL